MAHEEPFHIHTIMIKLVTSKLYKLFENAVSLIKWLIFADELVLPPKFFSTANHRTTPFIFTLSTVLVDIVVEDIVVLSIVVLSIV